MHILFLLFKQVGKDLVHLFIVTAWKQLSKRLSLKHKVGGLNPGRDMFDCQTLSNRCEYHSYTHTYCRAFGSGYVTICFNDLGLSRPGFEHPTFCKRGERSHRLTHCHCVMQERNHEQIQSVHQYEETQCLKSKYMYMFVFSI